LTGEVRSNGQSAPNSKRGKSSSSGSSMGDDDEDGSL
jgi:hypothetical protein